MIAYLISIATFCCIFSISAIGLNVILGYAGIFTAAHAAFFGIGAYVAAQLALNMTSNIFVACIAAATVSSLLSIAVALPALRVRDEYFVAASLGLQMVAVTIFTEAHFLTGGMTGLIGIPNATVFGIPIAGPWSVLAMNASVLVAIVAMTGVLLKGSFGRSLMAIRDNESAAQSLGKNVAVLKTFSVAVGCAICGVAGALYAFYIGFINVESFTLEQTMLVTAMVIIGGIGTMAGPIVGATILLLLPAALSFLPWIPATDIGNYQQIIYGIAMALVMIFRPSGIAARK